MPLFREGRRESEIEIFIVNTRLDHRAFKPLVEGGNGNPVYPQQCVANFDEMIYS